MSIQNQYQFKSRMYPEWREIFNYWDKKTVGYQFILDKILETTEAPAGKTFIDVGCGYGYLSFALTDMGAKTTALEVRKKEIGHMKEMKRKHGYTEYPHLIEAELKQWYREADRRFDYTLWLNVMHHIGLFDSREDAFFILNKMLDHSKAVFLMVRQYWIRNVGVWDIGQTFEEAKQTLIRETGAHLVDFGAVPYWQAGRPLYVLSR